MKNRQNLKSAGQGIDPNSTKVVQYHLTSINHLTRVYYHLKNSQTKSFKRKEKS